MNKIEARMHALNIRLPERSPTAANYQPYTQAGDLVFVAGQTARWNGELQFEGKVGEAIGMEKAREAARLCGLNVLLQLKLACNGELEKVVRCVQLRVYVQCADSFQLHAQVADGASNLIVDVFEENGKHARAAVGCNTLPMNSAVEVEGVFEVAL